MKHALEQLAGLLQFTSKVVRPGRLFLRCLYALQGVGSHPDHLVRLSNLAIADVSWWLLFAKQWNRVSFLWDLGLTRVDAQIFTDVSGSWGCGAVHDQQWLQLKWSSLLRDLNTAVKELIPVVLAATTFGTPITDLRQYIITFYILLLLYVYACRNVLVLLVVAMCLCLVAMCQYTVTKHSLLTY